MTDISDIWRFELRRGNSDDPRNGACVMDAVSWFRYGKLGDHPPCTCPVIAAFVRGINDGLDDEPRQLLRAYIPRLVGTVDPPAERARAEYLAWQAIRVFAPSAFDSAGLRDSAKCLRDFSGTLTAAAAHTAHAVHAAAAHTAAYAAYAAYIAYAAAYAAACAARAAAHTAAYAAYAAHTAAARAAAQAAVHAVHAAQGGMDNRVVAIFVALDGVLAIGRQAKPVDAAVFQAAVERFAVAAAA